MTWSAVSGAAVLGLPECLLGLLELLDSQGLAHLRRVAHLGTGSDSAGQALARAAKVAELRSAILDLLTTTKFPFVHASYVLGLNGPYYSVDTTADRHFGIPAALPRLLCKLFQLEKPGVAFTTIRIQKFGASANFDGKHRTLPISLHTPTESDSADQSEESSVDDAEKAECADDVPAFVLCLTAGCQGGHAELCNGAAADEDKPTLPGGLQQQVGCRWQHLVTPISGRASARWSKFSIDTWLRWYWPRAGDYYAITVTCEPRKHIGGLRSRQRRTMREVGFCFPPSWESTDLKEDSEDDSADCKPMEGYVEGTVPRRARASRLSSAHVAAAKRLLGLTGVELPTTQEIEEAYRSSVRRAHPDRAVREEPSSGIGAGWAISQLSWSRKLLREAESAAATAAATGSLPEWQEVEAANEVIVPALPWSPPTP